MSVAAPFATLSPFPWCVPDTSALTRHVDNLTLAQVMAFAWNVETFTLTTSGSATKGAASVNGSGTITSNPVGSSIYDEGGASGMWLPPTASFTPWASWAAAVPPRSRVCASPAGIACFFEGRLSTAPTETFFLLEFNVTNDPVNSGRYRMYYTFLITVTGRASPSESVQVFWTDDPAAGSTAWQNGTITIGGITFNWYSYYTTGATPSGAGTLAATSSNYTYPP